MKKTFLALAISLIGCTTFNASAQSQDPQNQGRETTSRQDKMYRPQKFTDFAFESVLLDINQQARMDSLNAAVKAQMPQNGQGEMNQNEQASQGNRDRGDRRHGNGMRHGDGDRRGGMRSPYGPEYIEKVKEILTPEQYTTFLENIVLMPYRQGAPDNQPAPRR